MSVRALAAVVVVVVIVAALGVAAFSGAFNSVPPTADPSPTPGPTGAATPSAVTSSAATPSMGDVILVAGDIASCASSGDEATGELLDTLPGTIVIPGDIAYDSGTTAQFDDCFEPSWGEHKARMKPVPGNHEYGTAGAAGYFAYFGAPAGESGKGYYAWDLGAWRLYGLNSNCSHVGGCGPDSAQVEWLREDLNANPRTCVAAYWHHPRFSSGRHGSDTKYRPLWQALFDADADLVFVGHDHHYERFGPQTAAGEADAVRGIRSFVAGMGGRSHYPLTGPPIANSEAHNTDTFGLLEVTLMANGYAWRFVPEAGKSFTDSGTSACH